MMELYIPLKVDFEHKDDKGFLVQLAHQGWQQINFLESRKGTLRGEHYHKIASEAFYVAYGSVNLTLKRKGNTQTVHFQKGDFFHIPPMTWHQMCFPEDCIMIALYDIPIEKEDGSKDIYEGEV